jgi:hypothetical protein
MYKSVIIVDDSEMESQITKRILFTKSFAENVETFGSAWPRLSTCIIRLYSWT